MRTKLQSISRSAYQKLVEEINSEINQSRATIRDLLKQKTVEAYWRVGKMIHEHVLEHKHRSNYGERLVSRLTDDVGLSKSTLYDCQKFYNTYPIFHTCGKLEWSKIKLLLGVKDVQNRENLAEKAQKEHLTVKDLRSQTHEVIAQSAKQNFMAVHVPQGRLHTYRAFDPGLSVKIPANEVMVDLGFKMRFSFETLVGEEILPGDFVELFKSQSGVKVVRIKALTQHLYTYKAYLVRVVDGDTIVCHIDFGFKCYVEQVLRLRHVDAPELKSTKGKFTKHFVEQALSYSKFLIIRTRGRDIYGRYLSDVWYLPDETHAQTVLTHGIHLNQRLLDSGLVEYYKF